MEHQWDVNSIEGVVGWRKTGFKKNADSGSFGRLGRGLFLARLVADNLAGDHSDKAAYAIHPAGWFPSYTAKQQA
jgi:hypothetical protein